MSNYIDTSKGKYIDVTELEKLIIIDEYDIICKKNFPYYSYGMTTDDFIDLINDCKKALLDEFCPSCHKNLTMFSASWKYNYCPHCGQRLDWSDNLER